MKLLAEILGMTNYCNLRCTYCEWKMKPTKRLDEAAFAAAASNMRRVGEVVREKFPSVVLVEYSGGEPFVYPPIVEALLDTFPDKWIRVSTNGSLIDDAMIERLAGKKAYMALSLDGATFEANTTRFGKNLKIFGTVNDTIGNLLEAGVPVMILCTLNTKNVDAFPQFVASLTAKYEKHIGSGLLTMPAHCVSEYDRDNGKPNVEQTMRFARWVATSARAFPIVARIHEHYTRLADFLGVSTYKLYRESGRLHELPPEFRARWEQLPYDRNCFLYDWQVSFHFLDDAIAKPEGKFKSFGCGMRAVGDLGERSIQDAATADAMTRLDAPEVNPITRSPAPVGDRCPLLQDCFVDWNAIDMIFSGQISLARAQQWNVMFRDPMMAAAVEAASAEYRGARRAVA